MDGQHSTCQIKKKNILIKCPNAALDGDPDELCILHSRDEAKDQEAFNALVKQKLDSHDYDFKEVFFPGPFNPYKVLASLEFKQKFNGAIFAKSAPFRKVTFGGGADFSKAIFMGEADFLGAIFTKQADFSSAIFNERTLFSSATFKDQASFSKTTFNEVTDFSSSTFKERPSFSNVTFEEQANFARVTFTEGAGFYQAIFTGKCDFSRAVFKKESTFLKAAFGGDAKFSKATFYEKIILARALFEEKADFSEANFRGLADFSWARFTKEADFLKSTIAGRVLFRNINPPGKEGLMNPFDADFRALEFQDLGGLRFQNMSLAQVLLTDTDLRRPEFHHVDWNCLQDGRQALYDEVLLRQRDSFPFKRPADHSNLMSSAKAKIVTIPPTLDEYGAVELLYRNLQVNYESVNDYKNSGDFHYGELEMHRRASKWRRFPLYWYNIYWLSSGYGERPLRAVLSLAGLLLLFAAALLLLGGVEEKLADCWNKAGFWQALLYVFQQGTLQKPDWLKPATTGGRFLATLMPILIPGQTALFFLALRNRLGRRR